MPGRANQVDHMAAISKLIEVTPHAPALRAHVRQVVESPAFRGSRRSQEFLQYIVDRALEGQFDELKERSLGVELFGRSPSYDTGDDSIVRVTARDLRKRLNQFYAESPTASPFRIELAPGSYIPEFRSNEMHARETSDDGPTPASSSPPVAAPTPEQRLRRWAPLLAGLGLLAVGLITLPHYWNKRTEVTGQTKPDRLLPWSALKQPTGKIHLIFCDPDIVNLQRLLNYSISLSDYANQHYVPPNAFSNPEFQRISQAASFRGANVAAIDAGIALKIANISDAGKLFAMTTHTARSVRLGDFKSDDSFVLLGSPRSNPWVELFADQLDFSFQFDPVRRAEFVRNRHPQKNEAAVYTPTTEGWGTGQAYAIVALLANPNQNGSVLIVAGSTAEATEAAGKLATNPALLAQTLSGHGIDPHDPSRRFELLLRVSTMAGSPNTFQVIACHPLAAKLA
jgi:hypothetical protein